jgi:anti-sigma factor RsiW
MGVRTGRAAEPRFGENDGRLRCVLMRRERRTDSWRSGAIVPCRLAREAISALADGEEPPVPEAITSAHLEGCDGCRQFQERVESLRRQMRVHVFVPVQGETAVLTMLGCAEPAPATRSARARWCGPLRQVSWLRASQWAAGVVPLGVAVPALALGMFHIHIVPSHVPTPCTLSLGHHARGR